MISHLEKWRGLGSSTEATDVERTTALEEETKSYPDTLYSWMLGSSVWEIGGKFQESP